MTSGTVSSLFVLLLSCSPALAQTQQNPNSNAQAVQFNQVLNVNGDMQLNAFQFPDRSKIETFSQKQQQIIVNQNTPSVPPNQVTGSTGQPFVALMSQSMSINTNGATDLVGGQVELVMDPQMLQQNAVNPDNTYVAKLSPDRQTWMIQESMRSVNISDNTVRMVKRQQLDGEYMALGRQTVETNTQLTPFGNDGSTQVAIQGTGLQENEFQDGFRMSVRATQPMTMNVNVKKGIDTSQLAALPGQQSVNDYKYSVTSNLAGVQPNLNRQVTVVQMPINPQRIQSMMQAMGVQPGGQVQLSVAQRGVLQNPGGATGNLGGVGAPAPQRRSRSLFRRQIAGVPQAGTPTNGNNPVATQLLLAPTFTPINAQVVLDTVNMRVAFPVSAIDGEYILTMQTAAAQPGQGQQQPQGQAAPPQQGQQPRPQGEATPQPGQAPAGEAPRPAAGQTPAGETPRPAEGQAPKPAAEGAGRNGTAPAAAGAKPEAATPEGEKKPAAEGEAKPAAEGEAKPAAEGEKKPERRQEKKEEKEVSGEVPPTGSVYITMREVNRMVDLDNWGGQAPISQMMNDFVKANNGTS